MRELQIMFGLYSLLNGDKKPIRGYKMRPKRKSPLAAIFKKRKETVKSNDTQQVELADS